MLSIIIGIVVAATILVAAWFFSTDVNHVGAPSKAEDVAMALLGGAVVGGVNFFAPLCYGTKMSFVVPLCLVIMIGVSCCLIYWWSIEGSSFKEMLPMLILAVIVFLVTKVAAILTAGMTGGNYFLYTLVLVLPVIALIASLGFFVAKMFNYRYKEMGEHEADKYVAIAATVIAAVIAILFLCTRVYWKGLVGDLLSMALKMPETEYVDGMIEEDTEELVLEDEETELVEEPIEVSDTQDATAKAAWYKFYNLDLQLDADPRNDFNFGSNPHQEGLKAEDYSKELLNRMTKDPALAAADMAWLDAIVGTRYLGEFYESCKGDWAKTINLSKDRFMADQGLYYETLDSFSRFLGTADDVSLDYQTSDLQDQMYMNPFTPGGVPDVVVMTTTDQSGYFLTYTFFIKGNAFKVSYRVDCGYQPTNVEAVMKIKPDDTPRVENPGHSSGVTPSNPGGKDPNPTPAPNPTPTPTPTPKPEPTPTPKPTPKPEPTPEPTPKKDPSKSPETNMEPNDDPGPGPNTNNGTDTAPADKPENSNHYETIEEYREEVTVLEEINQEQKTGNDPSTPSTPANTGGNDGNASVSIDNNINEKPSTPPEPVYMDNNGDTGGSVKDSGGGTVEIAPINEPTEVTAPAVVAETGQAVSEDSGAWGGPPD